MKGVFSVKLKPTIKGMRNLTRSEENSKVSDTKKTTTSTNTRKSNKENKLPSDEYKPMFPPTRFLVRESRSMKDPTKVIKQYFELSVKRFDDDEASPHVWIQMYQESDFYTGYVKGKTVYLPLEMLYDLIDNLTDLSEECDRRKIE